MGGVDVGFLSRCVEGLMGRCVVGVGFVGVELEGGCNTSALPTSSTVQSPWHWQQQPAEPSGHSWPTEGKALWQCGSA